MLHQQKRFLRLIPVNQESARFQFGHSTPIALEIQMKIYTKTGDKGETGLLGGLRVSKSNLVIRAVGELDETNSQLGLVRSFELGPEIGDLLAGIQADLFAIGSVIANCKSEIPDVVSVGEPNILSLENAIDYFDAALPVMNSFILPGGSKAGAYLHISRCVCRRAERSVVELIENGESASDLNQVVVFLNRLSDLLFVLARRVNEDAGCPEVKWLPNPETNSES